MIRYIALFLLLATSLSAQTLGVVPPRSVTLDGRVYARTTDNDTIDLANLPAMSAITGVYIIPEDTLWAWTDSAIVMSNNVDLMAWHNEVAGLGDCLGCFASDWPQTPGDILYSKSEQAVKMRLVGIGGDVRGTFRIIITYVELF